MEPHNLWLFETPVFEGNPTVDLLGSMLGFFFLVKFRSVR